jgi:Sulfotransferase family
VNAHTPILVTGAHRTGTTWVGKMLAAGSQVAYISEPLNVLHRPGVMRAPVEKWYTLICEENEMEYLPAFRELLGFRYGLWREVRSLRSRKDFIRMGRDFSVFLRGRFLRQRPLIKDPFAVFSIPWFADRLGCRVIVTVRHPAGFASSLKRLNWPFDFRDLLEQPLLMQKWLDIDRAEMELLHTDDIIGQAALLWRIVYRVMARMMQLHPSIIVVRHEDLSHDPIPCYRDLYATLDLDFTPKVEQTILNASSSDNPTELSKKKVHAVKLDSRANLDNWKRRLSKEEITRIRKMTGKTANLFYSDEEW